MIKKNENITWLKIKIIWWKIWKLLKIELLNTNGSENLSQKWEGTCSSHVLTNSTAKNHEIVGFFELF